ncbi:MAG: nucleotidyl transferase AbiEii/AbiGii toxin family protein [Nitrospira sp.]|nr:nucleotidyl transferase AbiEii/AbiGii toxin family protein [bacterium]MBL7050235.1 nucleotidyl transferase AbiEii/AbiGii toxin family protein [Nitrospira sp.]
MDFRAVLRSVLDGFRSHSIRYALIGGFALGAWGVPRGTVDLDFLVHHDDMDSVDEVMKSLEYECRHRSENVSQYISPLQVFGEIDILHAFRTHSLEMLERAVVKEIFNGAERIRMVTIEDLIGLKIQAIVNDRSRMSIDMADIEALMELGIPLNWGLVEEYFTIFTMDDMYKDLKGRYTGDQ